MFINNKIKYCKNMFPIILSQFICKYTNFTYCHIRTIIHLLSEFFTFILIIQFIIFIIYLLCIPLNSPTLTLIYELIISFLIFIKILLSAFFLFIAANSTCCYCHYCGEIFTVWHDIKTLSKYQKNILDLNYMDYMNYINPDTSKKHDKHLTRSLITNLSQSKAHTIILHNWNLSKFHFSIFHKEFFQKNKYVNHIYFEKQNCLNYNKYSKLIKLMECKDANLLYLLLLHKICKNRFNISKDIIKYKIIPMLKN